MNVSEDGIAIIIHTKEPQRRSELGLVVLFNVYLLECYPVSYMYPTERRVERSSLPIESVDLLNLGTAGLGHAADVSIESGQFSILLHTD